MNNYTLQDNFQWVRGSHAVKAGFQHQRLQDNYRARVGMEYFIISSGEPYRVAIRDTQAYVAAPVAAKDGIHRIGN